MVPNALHEGPLHHLASGVLTVFKAYNALSRGRLSAKTTPPPTAKPTGAQTSNCTRGVDSPTMVRTKVVAA